MPSSGSAEVLDLPRDVPTTVADVAALRLAAPPCRSLEDYLRFLGSLGDTPVAALRARTGPRGEPFRLEPIAGLRGTGPRKAPPEGS